MSVVEWQAWACAAAWDGTREAKPNAVSTKGVTKPGATLDRLEAIRLSKWRGPSERSEQAELSKVAGG